MASGNRDFYPSQSGPLEDWHRSHAFASASAASFHRYPPPGLVTADGSDPKRVYEGRLNPVIEPYHLYPQHQGIFMKPTPFQPLVDSYAPVINATDPSSSRAAHLLPTYQEPLQHHSVHSYGGTQSYAPPHPEPITPSTSWNNIPRPSQEAMWQLDGLVQPQPPSPPPSSSFRQPSVMRPLSPAPVIPPLMSSAPLASSSQKRTKAIHNATGSSPDSVGVAANGRDEAPPADDSDAQEGTTTKPVKSRKRRRKANEVPRDADKRVYGCKECSKSFARPSALKTHMRTHTALKPHACPQCVREFSVVGNLRRHQKVYEHYP